MDTKILIVDDEKNIRRSLKGILEDEGYDVETAESGEEAIQLIKKKEYKVIFLDVLLTGIDGIEALKAIKKISALPTVIMMSGHASIEMAIEATRCGAYNFFEKPLIPEKILLELEHIGNFKKIQAEVSELRKIVESDEMIGSSGPMKELRKLIAKIAPSEGRAFITGENGSGKELVARSIHYNSARKDKPFVKINCAAIPKDLIESELFGYEKGAFTGATARKVGRFEEANEGTLFLDEIGDMSLDTQTKLLRVLEENELVRLGGNETINLNVRVISATNQDIEQLIDDNAFREDLYFRLNVIPVKVPALRERKEDIPELVRHFAQKFATLNGKKTLEFDKSALELLKNQKWRGNIRELRNVIERIAILIDQEIVRDSDIDLLLSRSNRGSTANTLDLDPQGRTLREMMDAYEKAIIEREFSHAGGNVSRLASTLKIDRANLHRKLKNLGIKQ